MNIEQLYEELYKKYGPQGWWPIYNEKKRDFEYNEKLTEKKKSKKEVFEIIVGAILAQNTSWKNAEKALRNLIECNLLEPNKIIKVSNLKEYIKSAGFFQRKEEVLKNIAQLYLEKNFFEREELLNIKGIGKETADSILLYGFDQPYFVVDKYTFRLFSRVGIIQQNKFDYDFIQNLVHESFSYRDVQTKVKVFKEFHALIVKHSKEVCKKKPSCEKCFLKEKCNFGPHQKF